MDKLYIVMPAYNEEDNIKEVVSQWYKVINSLIEKNICSSDSRLIVADKGSTDSTHELLEKMIHDGFEKLQILDTAYKQHGPKLIAMYKYAIDNGADYVFQTDSDGQTNPEEFMNFWNQRKVFSCIFGNRVVRGDGKDRAFVEKVVVTLLKIYFDVSIPDANAPFRLIDTSILKKYIYEMEDDYNLPNIMLTTFCVKYGEDYKFIDISFKPRLAGDNSINIPKIIKIGWNALGDFRGFREKMKKCEITKQKI